MPRLGMSDPHDLTNLGGILNIERDKKIKKIALAKLFTYLEELA